MEHQQQKKNAYINLYIIRVIINKPPHITRRKSNMIFVISKRIIRNQSREIQVNIKCRKSNKKWTFRNTFYSFTRVVSPDIDNKTFGNQTMGAREIFQNIIKETNQPNVRVKSDPVPMGMSYKIASHDFKRIS